MSQPAVLPVTKARKQLFNMVKNTVNNYQQYIISSRTGDAVLVSREEYESLIESLELLSQPGLLEGVQKAKKEITRGETYSIDEVFGENK